MFLILEPFITACCNVVSGSLEDHYSATAARDYSISALRKTGGKPHHLLVMKLSLRRRRRLDLPVPTTSNGKAMFPCAADTGHQRSELPKEKTLQRKTETRQDKRRSVSVADDQPAVLFLVVASITEGFRLLWDFLHSHYYQLSDGRTRERRLAGFQTDFTDESHTDIVFSVSKYFERLIFRETLSQVLSFLFWKNSVSFSYSSRH